MPKTGSDPLVRELVIAGWTGRDEQSLRRHIRELEELGVKPPKTTPIFYRVAANLFTYATEIQVSGPDTSGEVEFVLTRTENDLRVAVGSDHTDRKAETIRRLALQAALRQAGVDRLVAI